MTMMMTITGLPLLILLVGSLVVYAAPVWLAARIVGAENPTLLRAILSLLLASALAGASMMFAGPFSALLIPLSFIAAYMWVLGAGFGQALLLGLLSIVGYAVMMWLFGGLVMAHFGTGAMPAQQV